MIIVITLIVYLTVGAHGLYKYIFLTTKVRKRFVGAVPTYIMGSEVYTSLNNNRTMPSGDSDSYSASATPRGREQGNKRYLLPSIWTLLVLT